MPSRQVSMGLTLKSVPSYATTAFQLSSVAAASDAPALAACAPAAAPGLLRFQAGRMLASLRAASCCPAPAGLVAAGQLCRASRPAAGALRRRPT